MYHNQHIKNLSVCRATDLFSLKSCTIPFKDSGWFATSVDTDSPRENKQNSM